tara:strand:- start:38295 stop:39602 length:1308 start_codon:yes stop_codon:yes gene_type:complete
MHISLSGYKKTIRAALVAGTLLTSMGSAHALETGLRELAIRQPWERYAAKGAQCQFNAPLNAGYKINVTYLPETNETAINLQTKDDLFVMNRLYQADLYIDFETQMTYNAVPLSANTIRIVAMPPSRFDRLFDGIEELSVGLDETLYVVDLSRIDFPREEYATCVAERQPQEPTFLGALSELNPFADKKAVKKPEAFENAQVIVPDSAHQLEEQADLNPPANVKKEWQPFLTTHVPEPYRLRPQGMKKAGDPIQAASQQVAAQVSPSHPNFDTPQADLDALPEGEKPDYSDVVEYNTAKDQGLASCGGDQVYEFSQIPQHELPTPMQGLDEFMTGNENADEDKELIQSLLVQLQLLEKEKEALRRRTPETHTALSVIRSCGGEQDMIASLRQEMREMEEKQFQLQQQQTIQDEIISAYEEIEGDNPPPPAPENVQ